MKKNKLILFTRIPEGENCKSRLKGFLSPTDRISLSNFLISRNLEELKKAGYPISIHYEGNPVKWKHGDFDMVLQKGLNLGERMNNALNFELNRGFDSVILLGSDIVNFRAELVLEVIESLDNSDVVISPAEDGGFGLIAVKKKTDLLLNITYGNSEVLDSLLEKGKKSGLEIELKGLLRDIDTREDIVREELGHKEFSYLGGGEYNLNYTFLKDGQRYVYRINMGSQLHLGKNQIEYEFNALKELEDTGVTPKVLSFKKESRIMPYGTLIMEYLEGRALDYDRDLKKAAYLLSRIHNHKIVNSDFLIKASKPFKAMYEEFIEMFSHYLKWEKREEWIVKRIEKFLSIAISLGVDEDISNPCIINTELNNRNFIIGEKSYVIDWEKPVIGEAEQDLAHFLVTTTTYWKTDKILSEKEIIEFTKEYEKYRNIDKEKLKKYLIFNTLRGITWCSMAKVEYSKGRNMENEETKNKIDQYLSQDFLDYIYKNYYEEMENEKTQR